MMISFPGYAACGRLAVSVRVAQAAKGEDHAKPRR